MGVSIVTDSTADIPERLIKELDITVIPALLFFGQEEYQDGELTLTELFQRIEETNIIPTTSQPPPGPFAEVYKQLIGKGHIVISIHLTSKHSGLYSTACLGRDLLDAQERERVIVVDSLRTTMALGLLVIKAARAVKRGEGAQSIVNLVKESIPRTNLFAVLDTLEYLKKGGRLGHAEWLFGRLLSLKPILTFDEKGKVVPVELPPWDIRTWSRAQKKLVELLCEAAPFEEIVVVHAENLSRAQQLANILSERLGIEHIPIEKIGSVLTVHAGPRATGACFIKQQSEN